MTIKRHRHSDNEEQGTKIKGGSSRTHLGIMATTLAQQKAVAIAPKFTSFASILGSSTCIFLLLKRSPKKKTYHRLVLGMSLCDLSASTAWFFTTWPIPAGTEGVYGAVGNQQTVRNKCLQAFPLLLCSPVIILMFHILTVLGTSVLRPVLPFNCHVQCKSCNLLCYGGSK